MPRPTTLADGSKRYQLPFGWFIHRAKSVYDRSQGYKYAIFAPGFGPNGIAATMGGADTLREAVELAHRLYEGRELVAAVPAEPEPVREVAEPPAVGEAELPPGLQLTPEEISASTEEVYNLGQHIQRTIRDFVTGLRGGEEAWYFAPEELKALGDRTIMSLTPEELEGALIYAYSMATSASRGPGAIGCS